MRGFVIEGLIEVKQCYVVEDFKEMYIFDGSVGIEDLFSLNNTPADGRVSYRGYI